VVLGQPARADPEFEPAAGGAGQPRRVACDDGGMRGLVVQDERADPERGGGRGGECQRR
jgi:hypothetical protein